MEREKKTRADRVKCFSYRNGKAVSLWLLIAIEAKQFDCGFCFNYLMTIMRHSFLVWFFITRKLKMAFNDKWTTRQHSSQMTLFDDEQKKCENKSGVALYPGFYRKKCAFSLFITQSWGWCWSRSTIFWLEDKQILILGILNEELPIIARRWSFGVWQFFGRQFTLISSHISAKFDLKKIWFAKFDLKYHVIHDHFPPWKLAITSLTHSQYYRKEPRWSMNKTALITRSITKTALTAIKLTVLRLPSTAWPLKFSSWVNKACHLR